MLIRKKKEEEEEGKNIKRNDQGRKMRSGRTEKNQ